MVPNYASGQFGNTPSEVADDNVFVAEERLDYRPSVVANPGTAVRPDDLRVPDGWIQDDPDFAHRIVGEINALLRGGLTAEHIGTLGDVLSALYAFVDTWFRRGQVTRQLDDEATLQDGLRACFGYRGLKVEEGSVVGGGKLDLFVADAILVENKFHGETQSPSKAAPAAGMQGRRYAIALNAQVVIVVLSYMPKPATFLNGELASDPQETDRHQ